MSNTVLIFHGRGGKRKGSWLDWLEKKLSKKDIRVISPVFPRPSRPKLDDWYEEFKKYKEKTGSNSTLCAHSIGCIFAFYLIEKESHFSINKLLLIAPPACDFSIKLVNNFRKRLPVDEIIYLRKFIKRDFDWEKIRSRVKEIKIYLSDNDYYIPFEETRKYYVDIFGESQVIKKEKLGHFNESSNVFTLPFVLKEINS